MSGAVREYTEHFEFEIPAFDFPGWHTYYDRNVKTIDSILYMLTGMTDLRGAWKNNEHYSVGDRVIDVDYAATFECIHSHTSPPPPTTFSQDRTTNSGRWKAVDFSLNLFGTSNSDVVIGEGSQTFETQGGLGYVSGMKVLITPDIDPTGTYMYGTVSNYEGTTLEVYVEDFRDPTSMGSSDSWTISISGTQGPKGDVGSIDEPVFNADVLIDKTAPQLFLNRTSAAAGSIVGRKSNSTRWTLSLGNSTAETGSNSGSDFTIMRHADNGVAIDPVPTMIINRDDGLTVFRGAIYGDKEVVSNGGRLLSLSNQSVVGCMSLTDGLGFGMWTDGPSLLVGRLGIGGAPSAVQMTSSPTTFSIETANAIKYGGGPWYAPSDARIKNVLGDYESGLTEIKALSPIRYTYKGNDAPTELHSLAKQETEHIGLVAQDVEDIMPELVTKQSGTINGQAVTDLRNMNTGPLVFALINAVKELSARIEALEADNVTSRSFISQATKT